MTGRGPVETWSEEKAVETIFPDKFRSRARCFRQKLKNKKGI
jgi:hypothetical protein